MSYNEPWRTISNGWTFYRPDTSMESLDIEDANQNDVVDGRPSRGGDLDPVYAGRIVACVNACRGMVDPAAELAALRKANEQLRKALEFYAQKKHIAYKPMAGLAYYLGEQMVIESGTTARRALHALANPIASAAVRGTDGKETT